MPYAPGVSYHGDQYLYQTLSDLGSMMEARNEKHRQDLAKGKAASAFLRNAPDLLQAMGMTQEQFDGLSAVDKVSTLEGTVKASAYKQGQASVVSQLAEHAAQMKLLAAHANEYDALAKSRADAAAQDQETGNALADFGGAATPALSPEDAAMVGPRVSNPPYSASALTAEGTAILDPRMANPPGYAPAPGGDALAAGLDPATVALLQRGRQMGGRNTMSAVEALARAKEIMRQNQAYGPVTYNQDPVSGVRTAQYGHTIMPSGVDPAIASQATALDLSVGTHLLPNGRTVTVREPRPTTTPYQEAQTTKLYEAIISEKTGALSALQAKRAGYARNKKTDPKALQIIDDQIQEATDSINAYRQRLKGGVTTPTAGAAGLSPEVVAVQRAFQNGEISRAEAAEQLRELGLEE
jgi:hypothetical protein